MFNTGNRRSPSKFRSSRWIRFTCELASAPCHPDALDGAVIFRVANGSPCLKVIAFEWTETDWSRDVFVVLPAAALKWPTLRDLDLLRLSRAFCRKMAVVPGILNIELNTELIMQHLRT